MIHDVTQAQPLALSHKNPQPLAHATTSNFCKGNANAPAPMAQFATMAILPGIVPLASSELVWPTTSWVSSNRGMVLSSIPPSFKGLAMICVN